MEVCAVLHSSSSFGLHLAGAKCLLQMRIHSSMIEVGLKNVAIFLPSRELLELFLYELKFRRSKKCYIAWWHWTKARRQAPCRISIKSGPESTSEFKRRSQRTRPMEEPG